MPRDLGVSATVSVEKRTRQLPETVLVHCTDVRVLLEKQCGKRKLNLESNCTDFGRRFLKFTLTLFKYQSYALLSKPAVYILQNNGDRTAILLDVCQAAESHY